MAAVALTLQWLRPGSTGTDSAPHRPGSTGTDSAPTGTGASAIIPDLQGCGRG